MEILIAVILVGLVFAGALSMYTSSLKLLKARQSIDVTTAPDISLEQVARKVSLALEANISPASQLNLRLDQTCGGAALNSPAVSAGDAWWHFSFKANALLALCDTVMGTSLTSVGVPAGTTELTPNLDTTVTGSNFQIVNPSGSGAATVIGMHVVSTSPIITIDTETALGATAKR